MEALVPDDCRVTGGGDAVVGTGSDCVECPTGDSCDQNPMNSAAAMGMAITAGKITASNWSLELVALPVRRLRD
jgi:hypothetical protein